MDSPRRRRRTAALIVLGVTATAVGACTPGADPGPVAEDLAADLTDGTFDTVAIDDAATAEAELGSIVGDLADAPRTVTVADVSQPEGDEEPLVVTLDWSYELDGADPLRYSTTAELGLVDDAWVAQWDSAIVHDQATPESAVVIERTPAERGDVLGFEGQELVVDREVLLIGIDKANLEPDRFEPAARALAEELALLDAGGYVQRVLDAGDQAHVVALTIRAHAEDEYGVEELRRMEGVLVVDDVQALAPTSTFARPILGSVGEADEAAVEASDGAVELGEPVGLSGLQRIYDEQLRGVAGWDVVLTESMVQDVELASTEPVDGEDLETTFDTDLQSYAETRLTDEPSASAVVVVQASTGQVLAAASGPGSEGYSTATVAQYPPGSTFKVVTALALLRAGMSADDAVECTETIDVDGRTFQNYPGYPAGSVGAIPLAEAIAQSCNTALIAQRDLIDPQALVSAAASLGIGAAPAEGELWPFEFFSGTVPTDADGTTHAADLIGQGEVLVSPLAMASVAASVAAGETVTPTLVVTDGSGPEPPAQPLTTDEARTLQELMYGVVDDGTSTFLQEIPGERIGAKSGTAQYGQGDPPPTHAWMIAFAGDLAVAVFVEEGDYGTETAGPILADLLSYAADAGWE